MTRCLSYFQNPQSGFTASGKPAILRSVAEKQGQNRLTV